MTIVVLGSTGRLGSALVGNLRDLITVDKVEFELLTPTRNELDISNELELKSYLSWLPDRESCIINCAAVLDGTCKIEANRDLYDKAILTNSRPLYHLAKWSGDGRRIIHVSTAFVFNSGEYSPEEYNEDGNVTIYGESKRLGELELLHGSDSYTIIRPDNLHGGTGNVKVFLEKIIDQGLNPDIDKLRVTCNHYTRPMATFGVALAITQIVHMYIKGEYEENRNVIHPAYSNQPPINYYEFARMILDRAHIYKDILCEKDGITIDTGNKPYVLLKPNFIMGDNYMIPISLSISEYLKRVGYKPKVRSIR